MAAGDGRLVLVVGPSGAGKDTLIDGAAGRLGRLGEFRFPRRFITRPADAGHENHVPVSHEAFERMRRNRKFALSWQAHGLAYGVSREIEDDLVAGRFPVVNVSRSVVQEATRAYEQVTVIWVDAPVSARAARLAARGRETESAIRARLLHVSTDCGVPPGTHVVNNDGTVEQAIAAFCAVLEALRAKSDR